MTFPFIPSLDGVDFSAKDGGLDVKTLSYLGNVFVLVSPHEIDQAFDFVQRSILRHGTSFAVHLDVSMTSAIDDITQLLDAGAAKVFVSYEQLQQLRQVPNLDPHRLVLRVSSEYFVNKEQIIEAVRDTTVGIFAHNVKDVEWLQDWLQEYGEERPPVYVSLHDDLLASSLDCYVRLIHASAIPIIPASWLSVDRDPVPGRIPVASLLQIKSDRPDGLITTVVTDERGVALGLVYSTPLSIQESLRTGSGVYHSRKRGLWYKGESSGDTQVLSRIQLDCDMDCLKFTVRQEGRGRLCPCTLAVWSLTLPRILSSSHADLLWRLPRPFTAPTDTPVSKIFCTGRFLYRPPFLLSEAPASKDHGRGGRAVQRYHRGGSSL